MFPASTNSPQGICQAIPDVCKTPTPAGPVPVPYPNIAMLNQCNPSTLAQTVKICGFKAATVLTQTTMSNGDQAGTLGGVVSNTIMGPCQFKLGSMTVKIEGASAAYQGSIVAHNNVSTPNMPAGTQVAPSQTMVTVGP
ncbi:MAG: DUF4150 domain-containing protein [Chthoniobacterales bacterium]|nr:DUF4150 domain-containing protein [Chthoniobacterales bacterium]